MTRTSAPEWPAVRPDYESLAACVGGEAGRWNVPGVAVGVLQDGHLETLAYGVTSVETRQPVTPDTIFQVGSISKVVTATLVMRLVEDGLLDLDTPVVEYLPDLVLADATARRSITLRQLLAHASGLEGDRFIDYGRGDDGLANAVATYSTLRQWAAPGTLWTYSNAGFSLVGRVVEAVTKETFEGAIRTRLFEPLGLERTVYFAEEAITWPHAVGHHLKSPAASHQVARPYSFPRHVNPAGGIVSSVGELLRFAALHIGDGEVDGQRLLRAASAQAMREPFVEAGNFGRSYGIGWSVWDVADGEGNAVRIVDHGGATRGFRAQLTVVPERGFALAQLTNGESGTQAMAQIEAWALRHYRGLAKRPEVGVVRLSEGDLGAFAGVYERHDGRFVIAPEQGTGRLTVEVTEIDEENAEESEQPALVLEPVGARRFRSVQGPSKDAIVDFLTLADDAGQTRTLVRISGRLAERGRTESGAADA
ncbi:serine hydrolase domain-containing protein [Actinopolymorpha pittospori]|uniref:CubicO group peptidase (Beta-lactamase class C family) n=1 Tax=Actinopolymorpha pittospori TaxID=648752 RepID=A0A927N2S6_9ACTN|nr:serine hydrolase domain-containing protein [Actinopolymorpha pittospori]MBE1611024.1 CubicO group peptidase (beta-lactamase class C family) [Actinopolymorpha pittospori]